MAWLKPITLQGKHCKLIPLQQTHHDELVEAVKDGELWDLWYTLIPSPKSMNQEIENRLNLQNQGLMFPFAIIDNLAEKAVGMTTFLNLDPINYRLEIGGTWLRKSKQHTFLNTEAKSLLLAYAFESLNCKAVEFRTHFLNIQSRKGIERLGAKLDGILRNHMIMPDNTVRDTCVYSIIENEWPTIKKHLTWLVNKPR